MEDEFHGKPAIRIGPQRVPERILRGSRVKEAAPVLVKDERRPERERERELVWGEGK
jgi:hypothetical protein